MRGHERYLELVAASIDFDLDPGEAAALASHLAACAECRREGGALQADARALRHLSEGVPSPIVRERVLAAQGGAARRRPSALLALGAAAALMLAVVGGLSAGALLQATRQAVAPPQPEWTRLVAADGFPAGTGQSGILAVATASDTAGIHLVAIGVGAGDGRVWVSGDGVAWTLEATTGLDAAHPAAIASSGRRLIAVGNAVVGGDSVATAWMSTDARHWSATTFQSSTGLQAVAVSPARIVVAGAGRSGGGLPIWFSTDGSAWTEATQTTPYSWATVMGVALAGPGFVAVGYDDLGAVVWTSTNGATWRRVDDPSFAASRMTAVAATPAGLVAVGGDAAGPLAWTSVDGVTWSVSERFGEKEARPTAVAATPFGVVAVGGATAGERAWVSSDGHEWSVLSNGSWSNAQEVDAVVAHGSLIVVAGTTNGQAGIWLGREPAASP
jgi:anti-sigma factor RsiW